MKQEIEAAPFICYGVENRLELPINANVTGHEQRRAQGIGDRAHERNRLVVEIGDRQIRAGGPWAQLPVIALTSMTSPDAVDAGREAGFTDYVAKFEREALLASLRDCLAAAHTVAA